MRNDEWNENLGQYDSLRNLNDYNNNVNSLGNYQSPKNQLSQNQLS